MAEHLVEKRNTKSPVWTYFGFVPDDDGEPKDVNSPTCKICSEDVMARDGNTSNLFSHLKIYHKHEYNEVNELSVTQSSRKHKTTSDSSRQLTIETSFEKGRMYAKDSREHKLLTRSVTECLAKDMLPMHTVDKCGFRSMLEKFNPRYELPSRSHFSRTAIPSLYCEVRDKVTRDLSSVESFSATTDLWSSPAMEPFLSYTVHYVNAEWELKSACLQALFTPEDHTGENLKLALTETLHNWKLDAGNQVVITTDNASNMYGQI